MSIKTLNFQFKLSYGVTVAHLTLDQLVLVRIQVGQQRHPKSGCLFFITKNPPKKFFCHSKKDCVSLQSEIEMK